MNLIPKSFYLDDFFDDFPQKRNDMKCDIFEENGIYNVLVDIPGFSKDDITIECNDGYLTITAEKTNEEDETESKKYIRRERFYGKYQRSFNFGEINENEIEATFEDGILKITIPKKQKDTSKKIIDIK